jgi:hypothetical protein
MRAGTWNYNFIMRSFAAWLPLFYILALHQNYILVSAADNALVAPPLSAAALGEVSHAVQAAQAQGLMLQPVSAPLLLPPAATNPPIVRLECNRRSCRRRFNRSCDLQRHYNQTGHGPPSTPSTQRKKQKTSGHSRESGTHCWIWTLWSWTDVKHRSHIFHIRRA